MKREVQRAKPLCREYEGVPQIQTLPPSLPGAHGMVERGLPAPARLVVTFSVCEWLRVERLWAGFSLSLTE